MSSPPKPKYRLVYRVVDDVLLVLVLAVDKREGDVVYASSGKRLGEPPMVSEKIPVKSARVNTKRRVKKSTTTSKGLA